MDKLIIPQGCVIDGEASAISFEGDITIENSFLPKTIHSGSGNVRLATGETETACDSISAERGQVDVEAQTFTCGEINARDVQINAGQTRITGNIIAQGELNANLGVSNLENCFGDTINLQIEYLTATSIEAATEVTLKSSGAKVTKIQARRVIIDGDLECKQIIAPEGVEVKSGKVAIKTITSPKFHATPEVSGIVMVATAEDVKAEGVRGFLHPSELGLLADGEDMISVPTADLTTMAAASPPPSTPEPQTAIPEPAAPEPVTPEPAAPEPATPEPATPEPAAPEPATPEPAAPEPATPEPAAPELEPLASDTFEPEPEPVDDLPEAVSFDTPAEPFDDGVLDDEDLEDADDILEDISGEDFDTDPALGPPEGVDTLGEDDLPTEEFSADDFPADELSMDDLSEQLGSEDLEEISEDILDADEPDFGMGDDVLDPESELSDLDEPLEPDALEDDFEELDPLGEELEEVDELDMSELDAVDGTEDIPEELSGVVESEEMDPEDALVNDLNKILNQVRGFFPGDNIPSSINQIQRYIDERRFNLFAKARNREAVLANFDKFEHPDISRLVREFFSRLENWLDG